MTRRVEDLLPVLALRVTAGPLELRGITDEVLAELCELAERGIHAPGEMPFNVPWSQAPPEDLARNTAQHYWRCRGAFSTDAWDLHLATYLEGRLVGTQGFSTSSYLVTRSGETGSWVGREHQGAGIGTAMRQAMCALLFDHLGAAEITSGAFLDNPASLAVSRKVGYRENGVRRQVRREGELALNQRLVLTPDDFVRGPHPVEVQGLAAFRRSIGLDSE